MGFDAEQACEALDWKFQPFVDANGTIPDPTDAQVRNFMAVVRRTRQEIAALVDGNNSDDDGQSINDELMGALVELCGGSPTREQLEELPIRRQIAFVDWLTKELVDPTRAAVMRPPLALAK